MLCAHVECYRSLSQNVTRSPICLMHLWTVNKFTLTLDRVINTLYNINIAQLAKQPLRIGYTCSSLMHSAFKSRSHCKMRKYASISKTYYWQRDTPTIVDDTWIVHEWLPTWWQPSSWCVDHRITWHIKSSWNHSRNCTPPFDMIWYACTKWAIIFQK